MSKNINEAYEEVQKNFRLAAVVVIVLVLFGSVFYHFTEGLSWIDSVYFCVITLTTIGYGDISPQTDLGKMFTVFYALAGIGVIATFANLILKNAAIKRAYKQNQHTKEPSSPESNDNY